MNLKLGIIGTSDGNGHPYSWSAIFNGYDPEVMEDCGFPVIPRYLEKQKWPESQISGCEVVAIWTQNSEQSAHIAKAAKISSIVSGPEKMIGLVDAILLARDDAENHLKYAADFLRAGLPIYIDKPIALSLEGLKKLYELEQYPGQIFTCSALRYSRELSITAEDRSAIGEIRKIIAFTPKSWAKYAIHIIEPVLKMLPEDDSPLSFYNGEACQFVEDKSGFLTVDWRSGIQTSFFATGDGVTPISIRVIGTTGYKDLFFTDSFTAFRQALKYFVKGINNQEINSPIEFNKQVVQLLEKGMS